MAASSTDPSTPGPPPIPGARWDSTGRVRRPLLFWVRTGTAHVRIDDDVEYRITDGEGVWIPADGWNRRELLTQPGTVAFPLSPDASAGVGAPSELTRFDVPDGWQDWLIQYYNMTVTPLTGNGYARDGLLELLSRTSMRRSVPQQGDATRSCDLQPPVLPRASGARAVAAELVRDPALDLTLDDWATRVCVSPRTLRRDFVADTGLTFEQWRLRCRLGAAVEFLAAGDGVDLVAGRVGFASRNGLTRAFKQWCGLTPHEFSRRISAHPGTGGTSQRVQAAHQAGDLVTMLRASGTPPAAPDLLPAATTAAHANDVHVLSWIYRGSGYLDVGQRRYERRQGVATWIPAGVEHVTGLREDSISLPPATVKTGELRLTEPIQVQFSPAWDDYLMFCAVSDRSHLRPEGYDPAHVLGLFREQVAAQRARSAPMPVDQRAYAAATHYLRSIGGGTGTPSYDLPAEVHRAFRDETGMTFARWRYAVRMRIAREMLAGGAKPSAVGRRVGYAHLPTFSAAFSRFHGLSPREYQERGDRDR